MTLTPDVKRLFEELLPPVRKTEVCLNRDSITWTSAHETNTITNSTALRLKMIKFVYRSCQSCAISVSVSKIFLEIFWNFQGRFLEFVRYFNFWQFSQFWKFIRNCSLKFISISNLMNLELSKHVFYLELYYLIFLNRIHQILILYRLTILQLLNY